MALIMVTLVLWAVGARSELDTEASGCPGLRLRGAGSFGGQNFRGVKIRPSSYLPNVPQMLSPTYKQRNEDFRKLFSKLPEAERLSVGESSPHRPQPDPEPPALPS